MTPDQYPNSLEKALVLWGERGARFPTLHGFGISGTREAPIYAFFLEAFATDEDVHTLLEAAAEFTDRGNTKILRIRRFREIQNMAIGEIQSTAIGAVPKISSAPLQAGGDVFARSQ